jgi:hypothetical protein
MASAQVFRRYHIGIEHAADARPLPPRFRVRVRRRRLAGLVLKELLQFRFALGVALSRPCVYGVFSRPVGGLAPREDLCVGCLRCTVEHPEVVQIVRNPKRDLLGGSSVPPEVVETILYEARTGRVPVRGAGYRGRFGGEGWDGMWLDMSEIVRPTRDGIHGREFISTAVDIGVKPPRVLLDGDGPDLRLVVAQVPFVFDAPPAGRRSDRALAALVEAARQLETLAVVPVADVVRLGLGGPHVVPQVDADGWRWLGRLPEPALLLLDGWDPGQTDELRRLFPASVLCPRVPADADVVALFNEGARVIHLTADLRGRAGGGFIRDLVRTAHERLVEAGVREHVTLIGSGGILLAEHVAKGIACGLDAVALDSALWVALQGRFAGDDGRAGVRVDFPPFAPEWGVRRLKNLAASWRDQLLEVLGAMGIRDVRRLRGEVGRCMFQAELEGEAFRGILGYEAGA